MTFQTNPTKFIPASQKLIDVVSSGRPIDCNLPKCLGVLVFRKEYYWKDGTVFLRFDCPICTKLNLNDIISVYRPDWQKIVEENM